MKVDWFHGAAGEAEKKSRKEMIHSARPTLDLLKSILEKRLNHNLDQLTSSESYSSPAWSEQQADRIGETRALKEIINLLTLDREK